MQCPLQHPGVIFTQAKFNALPEKQKWAVGDLAGRTFNSQVLVEMMEQRHQGAR